MAMHDFEGIAMNHGDAITHFVDSTQIGDHHVSATSCVDGGS